MIFISFSIFFLNEKLTVFTVLFSWIIEVVLKVINTIFMTFTMFLFYVVTIELQKWVVTQICQRVLGMKDEPPNIKRLWRSRKLVFFTYLQFLLCFFFVVQNTLRQFAVEIGHTYLIICTVPMFAGGNKRVPRPKKDFVKDEKKMQVRSQIVRLLYKILYIFIKVFNILSIFPSLI